MKDIYSLASWIVQSNRVTDSKPSIASLQRFFSDKGMVDGIMKTIYGVDISSTEERIPKNITIKLRPEGKVGNWQAEETVCIMTLKSREKSQL